MSPEEVGKLAKLVKLELSTQEIQILSAMFTETLQKITILQELPGKTVPETYQVTGLENVFQKDEKSAQTLTQEEALSNAKEKKNGLFVTKAVFDR